MIPKTIHYCWFGRGEKPELAIKCIDSWKKYCPDFTIIEWNEDNYDLLNAPTYVQQAYENKKWAFATDYVRIWAVHTFGGIYMDTDVELLRPIDDLLILHGYIGFETSSNIALGLGFGAEKGDSILEGLMESYHTLSFLNEDGSLNLTPGPLLNTQFLCNKGLKLNNRKQMVGDITIFPKSFFGPQNYLTGKTKITKDTYSIHHYAASWVDQKKLYKNKLSAWIHTSQTVDAAIRLPKQLTRKIMGNRLYERLRDVLRDGSEKK